MPTAPLPAPLPDQQALHRRALEILAAWNAQDVDRVLSHYAPDLIYVDPNTRGEVRGADAMRRYLAKLFQRWSMHWTVREVHRLAESDACVLLWEAAFRRPGRAEQVRTPGIDLVVFRSGLIARNEVRFDRSALAPLLATP